MKNKKRLITFALIILGVFAVFPAVIAKSAGLHDYYGGTIKKVTYCTCWYDLGVVIEVEDKSRNNQTVKVFYSWLYSRLRANYVGIFYSGPSVIGGYTMMSKQCKNTSLVYCVNSGTTADGIVDWIRGIGSSIR